MTPEQQRLDNAQTRLIDAAIHYTNRRREYPPKDHRMTSWQRELLAAAMDYAETVHFVEWLRAKQAEEREQRLSET